MGGFMALEAGANDPAVKAIMAISAADFDAGRLKSLSADKLDAAVQRLAAGLAAEGMAPLAGCTPESLAREVVDNAKGWGFLSLVSKLASRRMLVVTSDDGLAPVNDVLVESLHRAGNTHVTAVHFATDHSYSDHTRLAGR
jgi:hypothetical protein